MGIHTDISIEEYHSQTARCSHSRFRDFVNKGARFFFEKYIARTIERVPTKPMTFGSAAEILIQNGDDAFADAVYVQYEDGRKTHVKEAKAAAVAAGKLPIKAEEHALAQLMRASVFDCADAMALIEGADQQITITGNAYGLPMQSRPDWFGRNGIVLTDYLPHTVDLKTCDDLGALKNGKLYALGYHTQAALCRALMRDNGFADTKHYLLAVEKTGACRSQLIELDARLLDWADLYFEKYAPALDACMRTNVWPRVEPTTVVSLPAWLTSQPSPADEVHEESDEQEPPQ